MKIVIKQEHIIQLTNIFFKTPGSFNNTQETLSEVTPTNIGLLAGIITGVVVLLIAGIVVSVVCIRRRLLTG